MDKYRVDYRPDMHYQGHFVVFKRVLSEWWVPVTSRSSRESALIWIAAQPEPRKPTPVWSLVREWFK